MTEDAPQPMTKQARNAANQRAFRARQAAVRAALRAANPLPAPITPEQRAGLQAGYQRAYRARLKAARLAQATLPPKVVTIASQPVVLACQLAQDGHDPRHQRLRMQGIKLIDAKLDGVRAIAMLDVEAQTVGLYTRTGEVLRNMPHHTSALAALLPSLPASVALDAELVSVSFNTLLTQVQRRGTTIHSDARLAVFDLIPLSEFKAGHCPMSQYERHQALLALPSTPAWQASMGEHVYVLPKLTVDLDTEAGRRALRAFQQEAEEAGQEGIMVKDPSAPYVGKRSMSWLKLKTTESYTLTITSVREGEGRLEGTMGRVICEGSHEGRLIQCAVGIGFTDLQRQEVWQNRYRLIGHLIEVEADGLTTAQYSDVASLRFPRFKTFRSVTGRAGAQD